MKPNPKDVLNESDYRNYRNIRAVATFFVILGTLILLGSMGMLFGEDPDTGKKVPVVAAAIVFCMGVSGVVGGVAARRGNRKLAPLMYFMAFFYLFAFPIGTILSYVLFKGLSRYLDSADELRTAPGR